MSQVWIGGDGADRGSAALGLLEMWVHSLYKE